MDTPGKMKPQNAPPSSSAQAASQEHLANVDPNLPKASIPFMSKSSFKHELETSSGSKASILPSRTTDSLATHFGGATFASVARAAELQAARGRQGIDAQPSQAFAQTEVPYLTRSESMARKGRLWKKLDLLKVQDASTPPPAAGKENTPISTTASDRQDKESVATDDHLGSEHIPCGSEQAESLTQEERGISEGPIGVDEQKQAAIEQDTALLTHPDELVSQSTILSTWSISSPDAGTATIRGLEKASLVSIATPPVTQPAEHYNASLGFPHPSVAHELFEAEDGGPAPYLRSDSMPREPPWLPNTASMHSFVNNPDGFRVAIDEAIRSTYPFHPPGEPVVFYDAPSTSSVTQLQAKPPHCYPAVKGTQTDLERNAAAHLHEASARQPNQYLREFGHDASHQTSHLAHDSNNQVGGQFEFDACQVIRQWSQQADPYLDDDCPSSAYVSRVSREGSQTAADHAVSRSGFNNIGSSESRSQSFTTAISRAEWNLGASSASQSQSFTTARSNLASTGTHDPDSWKNRRAPVVNAASQTSQAEHPVLFNMRMTADGVFPVHDQPSTAAPLPLAPPAPRQRPGRGWYDLITDTYRTDGRGEPAEEQQCPSNKVYSDLFARNTPQIAPSTTATEKLAAVKENAGYALAGMQARQAAERDALREANFADAIPEPSASNDTADPNEVVAQILVPAMANLASYQRGHFLYNNDAFNRFSDAPSWCFDHGPDGNNSFFGGDWGNPPARVGRDPRYRMNDRHGSADWGATARQVRSDMGNGGWQEQADRITAGNQGTSDWSVATSRQQRRQERRQERRQR